MIYNTCMTVFHTVNHVSTPTYPPFLCSVHRRQESIAGTGTMNTTLWSKEPNPFGRMALFLSYICIGAGLVVFFRGSWWDLWAAFVCSSPVCVLTLSNSLLNIHSDPRNIVHATAAPPPWLVEAVHRYQCRLGVAAVFS